MVEVKFRIIYLDKEERAAHGGKYSIWTPENACCSLSHVLTSPDYAVGQWWELPNMESKGVFEGDIVECGEHRGVVRLVGIHLQPFDYLSGMDISHGVKPRYTPDTKVIGTIHENPELLEQTNGGN